MRVRPLAAFDVDGTIYRWSLFHELVERLGRDGYIVPERYNLFQAIQEAKSEWQDRSLSYNDYNHILVHALSSGYLKGIRHRDMEDLAEQILRETGKRVYVFTRELIFALNDAGYHTVAVTGSPEDLVHRFTKRFHFDGALATEVGVENGILTGGYSDRVFADKAGALEAYVAKLGEPHEIRIVVGDTANDFSMLKLARYPIALNPDQKLKALSRSHAIPIVLERKDSITALSSPGKARSRRVPRFFGETTLAAILPREIGYAVKRRLHNLGIETL